MKSGKATQVGSILNLKGTIRDIAWWDAQKTM
jgi:hypothetical protein